MRRLLACSIFTIAVVCQVRRADACWLPGGDGSCPGGTGGSSGPDHHSYGEPQLFKLSGVAHMLVTSTDDQEQYTGYAGDVRPELVLPVPTDGTPPPMAATPIDDGYPPSIACGTALCLVAWHTQSDATIRAAIRDASGWSAPIAFEPAIRAPAAAAFGDVLLVAWSDWVTDVGARVELRRVDRTGAVTGSWRLATGASHGHLSVTQTAIGGLVTWDRAEQTPGTISCWIDAQLLDATGAPTGAVLEQPIPQCDEDYYRGAPAAFAGSVYRVVHGGLGAGVPWIVVDPAARTIALEPVAGTLTGAIAQLAPLADGFALALSGFPSGIAHVTDGRVAQLLALDGAPTIAATPDGGLTAAYAHEGSVYLTAIPPTYDAIAEPQVIAARYEVGGGCSTGGGRSGAGTAALVLLALARRARSTKAGRPTTSPISIAQVA